MEEFRLNSLIRDNIKVLKPYSSARDEFKELNAEMVFIDANENPFETGLNRYPDPQQTKVKQSLASQKNVDMANILLGNGSDEVLDLIFRAFCEPKQDNIITLPPTYGMYRVLADINDVKNIEVTLTNDFQPNLDVILNTQNSNSKLLFLCSPNNPTANSFEASKIERLLINFKGIVVIDEAYIDFSTEESWVNQLKDFPNLIVIQTLSKAYGLAGIRLGVCYTSKEIISVLNRIKPPYNVNQLTQEKAVEVLSNPKKTKNEIQQIIQQRDWLLSEFENISIIKKIYKSDANFILAKVDDANKRYNQLVDKGIVARNRSNQILCENCLRFSVGTKEENKQLKNALIDLSV